MSRLLPLSLLALAGAIVLYSVPLARAGSDDAAKCYPTDQVLTAKGTDATVVAASAQVLINRQVREGRKNMSVVEVSGTSTLCFW